MLSEYKQLHNMQHSYKRIGIIHTQMRKGIIWCCQVWRPHLTSCSLTCVCVSALYVKRSCSAFDTSYVYACVCVCVCHEMSHRNNSETVRDRRFKLLHISKPYAGYRLVSLSSLDPLTPPQSPFWGFYPRTLTLNRQGWHQIREFNAW